MIVSRGIRWTIGLGISGLGLVVISACSNHFENSTRDAFQASSPEQQLSSIENRYARLRCRRDFATESGWFKPDNPTLEDIKPENLRAKKCEIIVDTLTGSVIVSPAPTHHPT